LHLRPHQRQTCYRIENNAFAGPGAGGSRAPTELKERSDTASSGREESMEITSSNGLRLVATLLVAAGLSAPVHAVNFGDMMNPGRWFGGNRDADDRSYGRDVPPPGYYGAPAYGYGAPYGYPQGGAAPYGQPAAPAAAPAYGAPAASAPAAPAADDSEARIRALEQRIKELEAAQQPPGYAPASSAPDVPQTPPGYAPLPSAAGSPPPSPGYPPPSPGYPPPPSAAGAAQPPAMPGEPAGHNFRPMGQN